MHVFERMFRRADLPIPVTQGFNPRPRMWFALSLALGIAGLNEVLEFEVAEPLSAEEVERRLNTANVRRAWSSFSLRAIDVKACAHVRRAWYRLAHGGNNSEIARALPRILARRDRTGSSVFAPGPAHQHSPLRP